MASITSKCEMSEPSSGLSREVHRAGRTRARSSDRRPRSRSRSCRRRGGACRRAVDVHAANSSASLSRSAIYSCGCRDSRVSRFRATMSSNLSRSAGRPRCTARKRARASRSKFVGMRLRVHERPVALLPVTVQVGVQVAAQPTPPSRNPKLGREALRHAAQEQAARERVVALREVAEVVADEVVGECGRASPCCRCGSSRGYRAPRTSARPARSRRGCRAPRASMYTRRLAGSGCQSASSSMVRATYRR